MSNRKFYATLEEASEAAQRLNIKSSTEYQARYREDRSLPALPQSIYPNWTSFRSFLNLKVSLYETLEEASKAAIALGLTSFTDYLVEYKKDPLLPSNPSNKYKDNWLGWDHFFDREGFNSLTCYQSMEEASIAARKLGIKTEVEYQDRFHLDPMLPARPESKYRKIWQGFNKFLEGARTYYTSLSAAREAAKKLGVTTSREYWHECKRDPSLPYHPDRHYPDWKDWADYLGGSSGEYVPYANLKLASSAVVALGIKSEREYIRNYLSDNRLPENPAAYYKDDWVSWDDFVGVYDVKQSSGKKALGIIVNDSDTENENLSFELARSQARKLKVLTRRHYQSKVAESQQLPLWPNKVYQGEWQGWNDFLGTTVEDDKYESYAQASEAASALGFTGAANYRESYSKFDLLLPARPDLYYCDDWEGWESFLGNSFVSKFYSLEDAARRSAELGIHTPTDYSSRYREDPLLPSSPHVAYSSIWTGWVGFLAGKPSKYYETVALASRAARVLGITDVSGYRVRYREDPRLHSNPDQLYGEKWPGFKAFLRTEQEVVKYKTVEEASEAAQLLGLRTRSDYQVGYRQDPRLPSNPQAYYKGEWAAWGWRRYFNGDKLSYEDAGERCRQLGITNRTEYNDRYREDVALPSDPSKFYITQWTDWGDFLLPEKCLSLSDVKYCIKVLKIKNSTDYRARYKDYSCLPTHPDRVFSEEWVDWYDLCGIFRPYSYEETRRLAIDNGVKGGNDYKRFYSEMNDARIPRDPATVYKDEWSNWYSFLNKPEPFKLEYLRAPYLGWTGRIKEFLDVTRGAEVKETMLCRFVREYIQPNELGFTPEVYITSPKIDLNLFDEFVNRDDGSKNRWLVTAVKQFFDWVIRKYLTFDDEETNERIVALNARNPFLSYKYEGEEAAASTGETSKPALAYHFVKNACDWMIPDEATTFGDLAHLHQFDADWIEVDPSVIDKADPNCVYTEENGKTKIWFPGHWMHTFALASVPARGKQLAYNDSGEGDVIIPEIVEGKIVWVDNTSPLAGLTKDQSFVKRYKTVNGDQIGMHFTSNKTSKTAKGYDVPWMPEKLAIWMIRFRNWQNKYNPISRAMPWVECTRTELNRKQLKAKGANCFLFRHFGEEECAHYSFRLKDRLAAALFHCQSDSLVLAECNGRLSALSSYNSPYSPHSMRVSLITAYVMEYELSLEVVMKVAGHSSIVMSLYYVKLNAEGLRVKFAEGEKKALSNQAYAAIRMIEQNRAEEVQSGLVQNNEEALRRYMGSGLPGSFLFRDYGFCPFAGNRCDDGGALIGFTKVRQAVPGGYLGMQNCVRCRHFVTGPVFIGGLLALANEISLQAAVQFDHIADLNDQIAEVIRAIDEQDDLEFDARTAKTHFDKGLRTHLEMRERKLQGEAETAAKKADLYLCDIQAVSRLINQCQAMLNEQVQESTANNPTQLIVQSGNELAVALELEDSSRFHLLSEVCENAEIYESASAELALPARSQMLDRMVAFNNLKPKMYALDKKQQLVIGNQLTNFILSRVKSWEKVDQLVTGKLLLSDLSEHERIEPRDITTIMNGGRPALGHENSIVLEEGVD